MAIYTLDGTDKEISVQGRYASVKNNGTETVYASSTPDLDLEAAEVVPIQAGESVVVRDCKKKLYVRGSGQIAVVSGNEPFNFFKPAPKGNGGGSGDGVTQQQLNDTLKSYATNASVDTKLEGYAEKDEIPTSLPADGGNADTLQGVGLSDGNGSKGIISIPTDNAPCEIGQFLDFHRASTSEDYTVRLEALENGDIRMAHKSGITGGTIHCDVDTVGGYTAEELIQSNPNLLLNPDFKINQRGQSEYSGANTYTIDRWRTINDTAVKIFDDYIEIEQLGTGQPSICQFVENISDMSGETVTFSAKVRGDGINVPKLQFFNPDGKDVYAVGTASTDWQIISLTTVIADTASPTTHFPRIYASINNDNKPKIGAKWVKLELGDRATPFVPPNPREEVLRCGPIENESQQVLYGDGKWANVPSNPNLLDNPDFRINQRGATSSDAYGYFIADRWMGNFNNDQLSTLTRNEDGSITIKLTKSMTGSYWWLLVQNGEDILKIGQTYTLSCKVRNATPSAFMLNTWGSNTTAIDSESGIYSITMYIDNLTNIRNAFGIVTNLTTEVDSSITIEWMKLEKGSVATPFVPPNPATELLKCQRYFENGHADSLCARTPSFNNWLTVHYFAVPKRVPPTITVKNVLHNDIPMNCTITADSTQTCFWVQATDGTKFDVDDHTYCVVFEASADL